MNIQASKQSNKEAKGNKRKALIIKLACWVAIECKSLRRVKWTRSNILAEFTLHIPNPIDTL